MFMLKDISGFDFKSSGTLTLKVYYNTAFCPPSGQLRITSQEPNVDAPDFKSLGKLLPHLHPTLIKPFETLRSYFDNLEESRRPLVGMLALDCIEPDTNRLKVQIEIFIRIAADDSLDLLPYHDGYLLGGCQTVVHSGRCS